MNTSDRHGNGSKDTIGTPFTTEVIEENPYLKRPADESVSDKPNADDEHLQMFIEEDDGPPTEAENQLSRVKLRRRRLALIGMAVLLLLSIVFAIALYRRSPTSSRKAPGPPTSENYIRPSRLTRDHFINQSMYIPPFTSIVSPTRYPAASEARNTITLATSSEVPTRPNGMALT